MNLFKNDRLAISFIIYIVIILSIFITKFFPEMPVVSDSGDYHIIASSILKEGVYPSIANQTLLIYPPFYPIFVSVIYAITDIGSFDSVYLIQYILVGITSLLMFFILRNFGKVSTVFSLFGALAISFWPYLILYSQLISSEILYTFLLLTFFILLHLVHQKNNHWLTIFTGVILGFTMLTRPVALLLFPWIIIGIFIFSKLPKVFGKLEIPWKKYLLIFVISIATLIPWEIYVYKNYKEIIPVASNLGSVFNKANKTLEYLPDEEKTSLIKAKIKNIYLFWNPGAGGYHLDIVKEKYPVVDIGIQLYKILFFLIVLLALVGSVIFRKKPIIIYSLLFITYTWAVHTTLFPFPRYTLPIMPFVIIVATITLAYGYEKYTKNTNSDTLS